MKIYAAVTTDPLPLREVIADDVAIFPAGTEVSAIHAGEGRWHLNAKGNGSVFHGQCHAAQLDFRGVLALVNEGGK